MKSSLLEGSSFLGLSRNHSEQGGFGFELQDSGTSSNLPLPHPSLDQGLSLRPSSPHSSGLSSHQTVPLPNASSLNPLTGNLPSLPIPSSLPLKRESKTPPPDYSPADSMNPASTNQFSAPNSNGSSPSPSTASSGTTPSQPPSKKVFRRSYKACINCRAKKIRCDLGDLSSPSDPPCARCRREGKKCEFSVSRRGGAGNIKAGREKKAKAKVDATRPSSSSSASFMDTNTGIGIATTSTSNAEFISHSSEHKTQPRHSHPHLRYDSVSSVSKQLINDSPNGPSPSPFEGAASPSNEVSSRAFTVKELHNSRDALGILAHAAGIQTLEPDPISHTNSPATHNSHNGSEKVQQNSGKPKSSIDATSMASNAPLSGLVFDGRDSPSPGTSSARVTHGTGDLGKDSKAGKSTSQKPSQRDSNSNKRTARRSTTRAGADACSRTDLTSDISNKFTLHPSLMNAQVVVEQFITAQEALLFIKFFFEGLHPFYPYIPESIQSTETLVSMPILLTVILTISSRYCKYAEKGTRYYISAKRGASIHNNLWGHCQKLVSTTVWGEASTRSIGTVYAFLLLSEWNPRAIHWRFNDYANSPLGAPGDKETKSPDDSTSSRPGASGNVDDRDSDESSDKEKPVLPPGDTAFSASERSDRMAWLFIGSSIRLAQDLGLFDTNSKVYLATHLSETNLALRLGRRSMLQTSLNEEVPNLMFTPYEEAQLSLLRIMSLAHQTIYPSKEVTRELREGTRYLSLLNLLGSLLLNWENNYAHLFEENSLEKDSILFDYHFTRLYIYSFALSNKNTPGLGGAHATNENIYKSLSDGVLSAKYIRLAVDAAYQMIGVVQHVHEMDRLCLAPIRWVVRLVHAAVFLVKTVLVSSVEAMPMHQGTLEIIRATAIALKESSPDSLHLANRYASILMNWVEETKVKCTNEEMASHEGNKNEGNGLQPLKFTAAQLSRIQNAFKPKNRSISATPAPSNGNGEHVSDKGGSDSENSGEASTPVRDQGREGSGSGYIQMQPGTTSNSGPVSPTSMNTQDVYQHDHQVNQMHHEPNVSSAESPNFEQLFSFSSQDPSANSNVFLPNLPNVGGVGTPNSNLYNQQQLGLSLSSFYENNPLAGANYGVTVNSLMNIYGNSATSSALAAISGQPNANEQSFISAIMGMSGGLNSAITPIGTSSSSGLPQMTQNSNNNPNAGFSAGAPYSGDAFKSFDFNFLEDGYEGLGFVDKLMNGMEHELEKKRKKSVNVGKKR